MTKIVLTDVTKTLANGIQHDKCTTRRMSFVKERNGNIESDELYNPRNSNIIGEPVAELHHLLLLPVQEWQHYVPNAQAFFDHFCLLLVLVA